MTSAVPTSQRAPVRRRRQIDRRSEAEQRLVAAAADLIAEGGPSSVTLAKVGERAGYSRGLAAHHFGSKAALMDRVAATVSDSFSTSFADALETCETLADELVALVTTYFAVIADPPPLNRARLVLIADAVAHRDAESRDVVVAADRAFRSALSVRLQRAADRGDLPADSTPDAIAILLVGLLRGIAFESMLDPTVDTEPVRREVEALITARF